MLVKAAATSRRDNHRGRRGDTLRPDAAPPIEDSAMKTPLPLVYSCSGCSSAAQMTNQMALWLDRQGVAEMSCIAGVGGGVQGLVRTATSGRPIIALDGCVLQCVKACLAQAGTRADLHLTLSDYGIKKRKHADFDSAQAQDVYTQHVLPQVHTLKQQAAAAGDEHTCVKAEEEHDAAGSARR